MPAMSQTQLHDLKNQLLADQERLLEEVRTELDHSGEQHFIELAGRVMDMGDQSVADVLADLDAAMIDRHVRELREIESALRRMAEGTYGSCLDCGAEVAVERLKAYPTAERCINCQSLHDKQYAHEGHPRL